MFIDDFFYLFYYSLTFFRRFCDYQQGVTQEYHTIYKQLHKV